MSRIIVCVCVCMGLRLLLSFSIRGSSDFMPMCHVICRQLFEWSSHTDDECVRWKRQIETESNRAESVQVSASMECTIRLFDRRKI